ncbi:MAG: bifunctional folylpolyglutamate synthase/dihydrofolate synthase [Clostridiales Family XIII bacterium]|jgi:dihydrofolate synthase/folylpolyglutamate synthase|nr:bifunctional folylpolyglutamate synthase/dihydrofolate synthase [Clostridiales Family XIII bacterium]
MGKGNAQGRIHEYLKFGSKLGLERMEALCAMLGSPEKKLRVIHVAGTNGKGSVCRYLYETLRALGYTAGIFTSPYVGDFRERIEADGEMISEEKLEALAELALASAETLARRGDSPTEFEIVTAIGFLHFAEIAPDFVVLEVGLGGRGDSTNIVKAPLVSVITQIALDHTDRLGETEEQIAFEKAGIIKAGRPVVSGAAGAAAAVIAKRAYELGAPLFDSSKIKYKITQRAPGGYTFDTAIGGRHYSAIGLSMAGEHQVQNAVTALCAIDLLRAQKYIVSDGDALRRGMKNARLLARFYVASENPLVIFDGAHNPDGARALSKTLRELLPGKGILFVVSILRDKAAQEMLGEFAGVAAGFVAAASSNERSLPAAELAGLIRASGGFVAAEAPNPAEAYNIAMGLSGGYGAVVFAGSLYMIGDVIRSAEGR